MFKSSRPIVAAAALFLIIANSVLAQQTQSTAATAKFQHRQVLASPSGLGLRFSSLGELLQMRLQVIGPAGDVVFDSQLKPGNVIDWPGVDAQGQRLPDGTYLCVVTVKEADGRESQRQAIAVLVDQQLSLKSLDKTLLALPQAQAAGDIPDAEISLTIVEPAEASATAILAHDGNTAHLVSGNGGLVIGSGNFFATKVLELVRITAEGQVGIGVTQPQVRLDVAGRIRASEGIVFPDGSVQFSASRKTFGAASLRPGQPNLTQGQDVMSPDIGGTGTTGKLSKWLDGPNGILNDSNLTEVSGAIGVNGTPNTLFRLDVNGSTRIRGSNPGFNLEGLGNGDVWLFQSFDSDGHFRIFGQDNSTPGAERLTINMNGNIGIGVTNPAFKLHIAGDVRSSVGSPGTGGRFTAQNPNSANAVVQLDWMNDGTKDWPRIRYGGSTEGCCNGFLIQGPGEATKLAVLNNGNVGIGVVTPAAKLDVVGNINTSTHYDIGGNSVLSTPFTENVFVGAGAGANTTASGVGNSFVGFQAGNANTNGDGNSFFGDSAGLNNDSAGNNSFFGASAGRANVSAQNNSFFGKNSGLNNSTGGINSFFGSSAGQSNTDGTANSYFGASTGLGSVGSNNSFFGTGAGISAFAIDNSSFFVANTQGANNISNGTAIGFRARVTQSNSLVLGSISGVNGCTAPCDSVNVGIGTTTPTARLDVNGDVKVSGAITLTPQTRHLSIPAAGFTLTSSAIYNSSGAGVNIQNDGNIFNTMVAAAMVNLPDGAVVTRVRAIVFDLNGDSGQNIRVEMMRKGLTGLTGAPSVMADVSSSGTGDDIILSDTSITNAIIDNDNFSYYIQVTSPSGSIGTWGLFSAIIDYTVTTPLP